MKKILIPVLLSTIAFSTPSMAAHPMCGKTELAQIMDDMKDHMKAVKKAVKAGDMDKLGSIADQLLAAVDNSYNLVPLAISDKAELTEDQKGDFANYQKGMKYLKGAIEELKAAKDMGEVKAALGKIGKSSKKGHKAFKMDCDA